MRVLVNRYAALGPRSGVGHYTVELLLALQQLAPGRVEVTPHDWLFEAEQVWLRLRPYFNPTRAEPAEGTPVPVPVPPSTWKRAWRELMHFGRESLTRYASAAPRRRCALYHEPNHLPLPIDLPTVVTVCDLSSLLHPQWHPRARVLEFERHFRHGLERCAHVLAISEFTRQEIIDILNVAPQRVTRTYLGIRRGMRRLSAPRVTATLKRLGLPSRYLLYVGTLEPRKNLLMLLRAYAGLSAALRERFPLVLAGGWGWKADAIAAWLDREARAHNVHHVGYVAERDLVALYNGARALVYPSLYEGFGLPPVEMLACGGAVLASTAGALVETVGAQAHLIAPEDEDGWRKSMARVLQDDDWWQALRHGAEAAAQAFTWRRCACETWQAYRTVCPELPDVREAWHLKAG
jgi:alpha-1,3-rhamnosyl/mannosyltransferase